MDILAYISDVHNAIELSHTDLIKAFPLLLKVQPKVHIMPVDIQTAYSLALAKCYLYHKRFTKAAEIYQSLIDVTNEWSLRYDSLKGRCICAYNMQNVGDHEVAYGLLIGHIADNMSLTHLDASYHLTSWIAVNPDYCEWVLINKLLALHQIVTSICDDLKTEIQELLALNKPDEALEAVRKNSSHIAKGYLLPIADTYLRLGSHVQALSIYTELLTLKFNGPRFDNVLYKHAHAGICISMYHKQDVGNIPAAYSSYLEMYKNASHRPNDMTLGTIPFTTTSWTSGIPGCRDWMIANCPAFKEQCGIGENLSVVQLSNDDIETKRIDIQHAWDLATIKEQEHQQPTIIISKKEHVEHKRHHKKIKKTRPPRG